MGKPGFPIPLLRWEGLEGAPPAWRRAGVGAGFPRPYAAGPGLSHPEVPGAHPS